MSCATPSLQFPSRARFFRALFDKADKSAQAAINIIKRQIEHITRLVDDLLDVSRITENWIELKRQPTLLADVIARALKTVEAQARQKHHELTIVSSFEPVYVNGDFERLVQCVGNLLTNAIKYTDPHGQIRVQLRCDEATAVVEITDNGTGISSELLPKVFDLFVQSDRTLDAYDNAMAESFFATLERELLAGGSEDGGV